MIERNICLSIDAYFKENFERFRLDLNSNLTTTKTKN